MIKRIQRITNDLPEAQIPTGRIAVKHGNRSAAGIGNVDVLIIGADKHIASSGQGRAWQATRAGFERLPLR